MVRKTAAERRAELIGAGLRVIAREGMHGATVRAIVAEAGVPLATFHYVFDSRDQMIGVAYEHVSAHLDDVPLDRLPDGTTPLEAARMLLGAWFDRFVERPEQELAVIEIMAHCRRTPSLEHLSHAMQERYLARVTAVVHTICERSGVTSATPPGELAEIILNVGDGITLSWLRSQDTAAARRVIEATARLIALAVDEPL